MKRNHVHTLIIPEGGSFRRWASGHADYYANQGEVTRALIMAPIKGIFWLIITN